MKLRYVENAPDTTADAVGDSIFSVVFDDTILAIFVHDGDLSVGASDEMADGLRDAIMATDELSDQLGRFEESPALLIVRGNLVCDGRLIVADLTVPADGWEVPSRYMLLVEGNVNCKDLYLGTYSHVGIGGDLQCRVAWIDDSDGATIAVQDTADITYLSYGQQIHDLENLSEECRRIEYSDRRLRPEARHFHSLVSLFDEGESIERSSGLGNGLLVETTPPGGANPIHSYGSPRDACRVGDRIMVVGGSQYGFTMCSDDDGKTWEFLDTLKVPFYMLNTVDAHGDTMVLGGNWNTVMRSTDGGATWEKLETPAHHHFRIRVAEDGTWWCGSDAGLLQSDDGKEWSLVEGTSDIRDLVIEGSTPVLPLKEGKLFYGVDGELLWDSASEDEFNAITIVTPGVFMVGTSSGVWRVTRDGDVDEVLKTRASVEYLTRTPDRHIFAAGRGILFHSADDGESWTELEHRLGNEEFSCAVTVEGKAYVGGESALWTT